MTPRRLLLLVGLAGCLPSERLELELAEETRSLLVLLVPSGDTPRLFVESSTETLPLNVGDQDTLYVGEYPYAKEELGIGREPMISNAIDCPRRPFPKPLNAWRWDTKEGTRSIDELAPELTLPPFEIESCFEAGGCLRGDATTIPHCAYDCALADPMPPMPPELGGVPAEAVAEVPQCDRGWLVADQCTHPDPCDAEGWPLGDGVYVDPDFVGAGDGSRLAPYQQIAQAAAARPERLLLKPADRNPYDAVIVDWDVELLGCSAGGRSAQLGNPITGQSALAIENGSVVTAIGLGFVAPVEVRSGQLSLTSSWIAIDAIARPALTVSAGMQASLQDVGIVNLAAGGIEVEPGATLSGEGVYFGGASEAAIGATGATVTLSRVAMRFGGSPGGAAIAALGGSTLSLTDARIVNAPFRGVQLVDSNATLEDVAIAGFGKQDPNDANAIRIVGSSSVTASRIVVKDGHCTAELCSGDGIVVRPTDPEAPNPVRPSLLLRDALVVDVHDGIRVFGVVELTGVAIARANEAGLRLVRSHAVLRSIEIRDGRGDPSLDVQSSSVTAERIQIRARTAPALRIEAEDCAACMQPSVAISDLIIEAIAETGGPGLSIEADEATRQRFERARIEGFGPSLSIDGRAELADLTIDPSTGGQAMLLGSIARARLDARGARIGGSVVIADLERAQVDLEETTFDAPLHVLELPRCDWELPFQLLQGIRVVNAVEPAILWPP